MPGILPVYDVNDKDINEISANEFNKRGDMIAHYWRYYDGMHHKPLKMPPGQSFDDNVILNLCGRAIDRTVEFMGTPEALELPGNDDPQTEATADQQALDMLYADTRDELGQWEISGLVSGHNFVKINQNDDGTWRLDLLNPLNVQVFWDMSNVRRVLFYRMEWAFGDTKRRVDIVPDWLLDETPTPRPPETWAVIEYQLKRDFANQWTEVARDVWGFPFAPIIDWQNEKRPHQYYGVSSLVNGVQLNDAINFVASNTARIIKFHAHPRTITIGVDAEKIQKTSIDGMFSIANKEAEVFNLEMQSDLASSMGMLNQLKAEFFANQRVVDLTTVRDKLGQITNFGVRMLFNEQLENTEEKRDLYGMFIAEAYRRLMVVMGALPVEADAPVPRWNDPLPINRLEALQAAEIELRLGVSKQTVFDSIERDYFAEVDKKDNETQGDSDTLVNILERVGNTGAPSRLFANNGIERQTA